MFYCLPIDLTYMDFWNLIIYFNRGLDFRPDYRKVTVLQSIMESPVLALTATATTDILADVKNTLCLNDVKVLSVLPDRYSLLSLVLFLHYMYDALKLLSQ